MNLFAVCSPGLETAVARELGAIAGVRDARTTPGGVDFEGDFATLCRANLCLRAASRVLVRVGDIDASDFPKLERSAANLPWEPFAAKPVRVTWAVTVRKSRLYHTGAIAERIGRSMKVTSDPSAPELHVVVRGEQDRFTISVDSSGELLHRRGYRLETAKAPLRETLAAGVLALAGWDPLTPLGDPMCGSGTFVIEAALLALSRAPGLMRRFAFQDWPQFSAPRFAKIVDELRRRENRSSPLLWGSDRDAGTIAAATRNAERAEVLPDVRFACVDIAQVKPSAPGLIVCNLPYGRRLAAPKAPITALFRLAEGSRLAVLTADKRLFKRRPDAEYRLDNGGLPVWLCVFEA